MRERHFLEVSSTTLIGMSNEDDQVSDDDYQDSGGSSQESARDIMDRLLQSPAALEAFIGRGLLPPLMSQSQPTGGSEQVGVG